MFVNKQSTMGMREFIALMAFLMSVVAISIDALLPALDFIARDFTLENRNHAQYVVGFIFGGMAIGQLLWGPLSDAFGRKPVLYIGIFFYLVGSVICFFATNFDSLLIGRLIQGVGVAGPYVTTVSIVRDKYAGRDMARIMSMIMMIFIVVPAVAPSLGQGILLLGSWRNIFLLYIVYSLVISIWLMLRMQESLPRGNRIPFTIQQIGHGFREVLSNRISMGYMVCAGICFGSFIGYLNSSQQIFQSQFGVGQMFTVYFGLLALVLGAASLVNARLVARLGMAYICLRSFLAIVMASMVFLALHLVIAPTLLLFLAYAAILFFSFGLVFGNLNALAMEPMGHIAGIASAVIGSISSLISLVIGGAIGQMYDGTLIPIATGFLVLGSISVGLVYWIEAKRVPTEGTSVPA